MSPIAAIFHRALEEGWEDTEHGSTDYFSVPVFFVLLRETVEVCLIVSTTFAYLSDNNLVQFQKYAVFGVLTGTLLFVIVGAALIAVFYTVKNNAFSDDSPNEKIFEGTLMLFSSIVITVFGIGMSKMFNGLNAKMSNKLKKISRAFDSAGVTSNSVAQSEVAAKDDGQVMEANEVEEAKLANCIKENNKNEKTDKLPPSQISKPQLAWGVFNVTLFAVVREGLECIVFLAGMTSSYPAQSVPIAAIMGILTGCLLGYGFYRGGKFMNLKWFAIVSMVLLFMVAGGLVARSFGEWVELGAEGGPYVWDARDCCSTDTAFWGFLRIIFGYHDHPTVLEFMIYWAYWIVLIAFCMFFKVFDSFSKLEEADSSAHAVGEEDRKWGISSITESATSPSRPEVSPDAAA